MADDKERSPGDKNKHPIAEIIHLSRPFASAPVIPDRASAELFFGGEDDPTQLAFDFLGHDLRGLKIRYLASLHTKEAAAEEPQLPADLCSIADRVAASFDSLIRLTELLASLPHDNDDGPA